MERHDHAVALGPLRSKGGTVKRSGTVQVHERRRGRGAGAQHHGGCSIDVEFEPLESLGTHAATFRRRRRGMTSSAKSVEFFTTFQFGMSPSARFRLTRVVLASSIHPPIA